MQIKHSIYFSKEASENFGRIKSTHSLLFNFIKIMQRDFYDHLGSIHSTHIILLGSPLQMSGET